MQPPRHFADYWFGGGVSLDLKRLRFLDVWHRNFALKMSLERLSKQQ